MNQILHCYWLPGQAIWCNLDCSGLPEVSCKKIISRNSIVLIVNPFFNDNCRDSRKLIG